MKSIALEVTIQLLRPSGWKKRRLRKALTGMRRLVCAAELDEQKHAPSGRVAADLQEAMCSMARRIQQELVLAWSATACAQSAERRQKQRSAVTNCARHSIPDSE